MSELRALRYVIAVAEERSFSRAARRLGVAQPTLSRAVRAFEDEHGVLLFERTTRSVALTDAGALVVDQARATLHDLERTLRTARGIGSAATELVRLGFVVSAANAVVPALLRHVRRHQPGFELRLEYAPVDGQVLALRQRRIDIGLLGLPADVATDRLVVEPLLHDPHVLAVPQDHRLAGSTSPAIPLRAVRDEPFVFWPRPLAPGVYDEIMAHVHAATGAYPRIVTSTRDTQGVLALVAAGVGLSLIPLSTATVLHRTGVVYRTVADPTAVTLAAVHRPNPGPAVHAVLAACRAALSDDDGPTTAGTAAALV